MRRISIAIALGLLAPSFAQADSVAPLYCRVRYDPYAFGYRNNGLVPGGMTYSPYALRPGSSGLVFEGVRYIPYALTYKSAGLVLDYYWYPIPYVVCDPSWAADRSHNRYAGVQACNHRNGRTVRSQSDYLSRDATTSTTANRAIASTERQDAITIIRQYLRERGLSDVGINRTLRVDGKLVSADFTVASRNLLIKYWDPTTTESGDAKGDSRHTPAGSIGARLIEKYKKDWETYAAKYQQDGGEIYVVAATGRTDIVSALDACPKVGPGGAKPTPQTMYARQ